MEETTIDRLVLQLGLDSEEFKQQLKNISKGLEKLQKQFIDAANANDNFNKKKENSDSKADAEQRKREREAEKLRKKRAKERKDMLNDLDNALKKIFAIGGISFGVKSLNGNAENAAKSGTNLANQSRNINVSGREIDAINKALKLAGMQEGALDDLINKLSLNQSLFRAGRGGMQEVVNMLNMLNGAGNGNIDYIDTSPVKTIKEIAKLLQSKDKYERASLISYANLNQAEATFLSNPNALKFLERGYRMSIFTDKRIRDSENRNAAIESSKLQLENEWQKVGESFTPVTVGLNKLAANILKEVNKMSPQLEQALPALNKISDTLLEWSKKMLDGLIKYGLVDVNENFIYDKTKTRLDNFYSKNNDISDELKTKYEKIDKNVDKIDRERGVIYLRDGGYYAKNFPSLGRDHEERDYFNFLLDNYNGRNLLQSEISSRQIQQQSIQQKSYSNQSIMIHELNVTTNAENLRNLVGDAFKETKFFSTDVSSMLPYINNVR